MITLEQIKSHDEVNALISYADRTLEIVGYTEHGFRHATISAERAGKILRDIGFDERRVQLAEMAGYIHDIGNIVNRQNHAQHSAHLAHDFLLRLGMPYQEILEIVSAIGNHHEDECDPVSDISAALILADKSDVHRSRVRNPKTVALDIHDRVNYAARDSKLAISDADTIVLSILIDPDISSVMEYFEIFLTRMIVSRRASQFLGKKFQLIINGVSLT